MPQHASRILQYSHEHRNVRRLIFDRRSRVAFLCAEELTQLAEAGKTPIAFLRNETMVCVCNGKMRRDEDIATTTRVRGKGTRTADGVDCWIVGVGDNKGELCASVPPFGRSLGVSIV